jgi:hypothetical protein
MRSLGIQQKTLTWVPILAILLSFASLPFAATNVQNIQTWRSITTNGSTMLEADMVSSAVGGGTWNISGPASYALMTGQAGPPYRFPGWFTLGGTNYTEAHTNWLRWSPAAGTPLERAQFISPGSSGGSYTQGWMQGYMRLDVTNDQFVGENFDLLEIDGSGYCIMQLETSAAIGLRVKAHSQGGAGTNGWQIPIIRNKLYWYSLFRDPVNGCCKLDIYDATNNFAAVPNVVGGTGSVGAMTSSGTTWRFWLQANYAVIGGLAGTNWFSSIAIGYGNGIVPPRPDTNIVIAERTSPLTVGYNLGVRGATRPTRTLETNITFYGASTNSADNTAAFAAAFAAAASNTVILVDGGPYRVDGLLNMSRDGVTLRGTNNATIIYGPSGNSVLGPTTLSPLQAKVLWVTNGGILKGQTSAVLTTNYSIANAGVIAPNQMWRITQLDGDDPQQRRINTFTGERTTSAQDIYITRTNGNAIDFWPPAVMDYTNVPVIHQRYAATRLGMGLENIHFTSTNAGQYYTNTASTLMFWRGVMDSWITGCRFTYGNNYAVYIESALCSDFNSNIVAHAGAYGSLHGGIQPFSSSGLYLYDNVVDSVSPGIQLFGGVVGSAFVGNFVTNTDGRAIRYHAPGNNMLLFEGNVMVGPSGGATLAGDGYFGSNEKSVYFRNELSSFSFKRFSPTMTAIANNVGTTNYNMRYDMYASGGDYEIFEMGFPNLGNLATNGISPPIPWNFPQTFFTGSQGAAPYLGRKFTNVFHKFTNVAVEVVNGTNILGNFTNWPYGANGGYHIVFQDEVNTNRYWRYGHFTNDPIEQQIHALRAHAAPTETNMILTRYMPISNGWTMMIWGNDPFQQRQTIDDGEHMRHFNRVFTNMAWSVVADPAWPQRKLPKSLLFAEGSQPDWWGTNRWPAIAPEESRPVAPIPAQVRYLGVSQGGGGDTPATPRRKFKGISLKRQ